MLYNANLSVVANPRPILSLLIGFPIKFLDFSGLRKIIFWYRIYHCCAMVERKSFKTKICVLYKRGRCSRQDCPFAHGDAELRRFSGSFHGKLLLESPLPIIRRIYAFLYVLLLRNNFSILFLCCFYFLCWSHY